MAQNDRQRQILELVRQRGFVSIDELAGHFAVTPQTVRRDINDLCGQDLLRRYHGGAGLPSSVENVAYQTRQVLQHAQKRRIAALAASLFRKNDTLMIDTGTTTLMLSAALAAAPKLTVITNSFGVARELGTATAQHKVYVVGGEFRPATEQTLGSACLEQISRYRADHAILSCGALDPGGGIMDFDLEDAMCARAMIDQAESVTLIVDSSKFDRVAMAKVCDLDMIDRLVTDTPPPPPLQELVRKNGVELLVASEVET